MGARPGGSDSGCPEGGNGADSSRSTTGAMPCLRPEGQLRAGQAVTEHKWRLPDAPVRSLTPRTRRIVGRQRDRALGGEPVRGGLRVRFPRGVPRQRLGPRPCVCRVLVDQRIAECESKTETGPRLVCPKTGTETQGENRKVKVVGA